MPLLTALAISIGVLGAIATYLFLGPLGASGIQLWVIFVAWACFYHCGGKESGLINTIVHMIFGAFCAWLAFVLVTKIPLAASIGLPAWAAICVGLTIVILVLAANLKPLSVIPATVYGYATTAAFGVFMPIVDKDGKTISEAGGAAAGHLNHLFAYVSEKIGVMLNAGAAAAKPA